MENYNVGDIVCVIKYGKVTESKDKSITIEDVDSGEKFTVIGNILDQLHSADRVNRVEKATRTELATILADAQCVPFTAIFDKKLGEERKIRARLIEPNTILGRSIVEDLDKNAEDRICQIDHRSIKELTIGGIKYELR